MTLPPSSDCPAASSTGCGLPYDRFSGRDTAPDLHEAASHLPPPKDVRAAEMLIRLRT